MRFDSDALYQAALHRQPLLYRATGTAPGKESVAGLRLLELAVERRDADLVEAGVMLGHVFGFDPNGRAILMQLAGEGWHHDHENIAAAFETCFLSDDVVEVLAELATRQFGYLAFDDTHALSRRCRYVLAVELTS